MNEYVAGRRDPSERVDTWENVRRLLENLCVRTAFQLEMSPISTLAYPLDSPLAWGLLRRKCSFLPLDNSLVVPAHAPDKQRFVP